MNYPADRRFGGERKLRICFLFNAQRHQLLHGIGTAYRMAADPRFEVTVMSPSQAHLEYARSLCGRWGEDRIAYVCPTTPALDAIWRRVGGSVPPKVLTLAALAPVLRRFDAIAVPERTSILLKRFGVRASFVHLDHGAGDRAAGFDRRIRQFDFVLMAGEKHRARLMREGLIRERAHAIVGYPKFEAADAAREVGYSPFPGDPRPIVLYNPHFCSLGSWETMGAAVLEAFAAQDRYNLILAPHIRLFDSPGARQRWGSVLRRYAGHPRIFVDLGSDRSIDMTYTTLADVYLGDVSSQVYEFLRSPRPCLFLDPHGVDWQYNENYAHWRFGPVAQTAQDIIALVDKACADHPAFVSEQRTALAETFSQTERLPSERAAAAIARHMIERCGRAAPVAAMRRPSRLVRAKLVRRAAMIAPAVLSGWLLHDVAEPSGAIAADYFVGHAVASHETLLVRGAMHSQPETQRVSVGEVRAATGIAVPTLPSSWRVRDMQVFPSRAAGPGVYVLVDTDQGERFTIALMRIDTPAERLPLVDKRKGESVVYWEQNDLAVGLVGRLPPQALLRLAGSLATQQSAVVDKPAATLAPPAGLGNLRSHGDLERQMDSRAGARHRDDRAVRGGAAA